MADVYMAGDLRNGTTFEMEGSVYKVVEFQHVKPGKGAAFVRTKLKNVINGSVLEKTFNPSEKLQGAEIEKRDMQYLYSDEDLYYFMDNESYEQIPLNKEQIGDALKFIKENMNCKILSFKGNVFAVEPPMFVELEVTYTEPGFSGNTTTTSGKPATLENGYEISVPLFVNIGDVIRIDTRTGEYMERIQSKGEICLVSDLEEQYQKMIETLENTIKDEKKLKKAKEQLDDIVSIVVDDCSHILDKYDEKIMDIESKNRDYEMRIQALEERLRQFEQMVELEDYDFFITCPYCNFEFQTDYDDEVTEVCCPECGQIFDVDWEDDEDEDSLDDSEE